MEVWSQRGQKPSREGHLGHGDGSQKRHGGGTGWDWEPARDAEGEAGNLHDGLSLAKGARVGPGCTLGSLGDEPLGCELSTCSRAISRGSQR